MHLTRKQERALLALIECETAEDVADLLEDTGMMSDGDATALDVYLRDEVLGGEPYRVSTIQYHAGYSSCSLSVWCGEWLLIRERYLVERALDHFVYLQETFGRWPGLDSNYPEFLRTVPGWTEEEERDAVREGR